MSQNRQSTLDNSRNLFRTLSERQPLAEKSLQQFQFLRADGQGEGQQLFWQTGKSCAPLTDFTLLACESIKNGDAKTLLFVDVAAAESISPIADASSFLARLLSGSRERCSRMIPAPTDRSLSSKTLSAHDDVKKQCGGK